MQTQTVSTEAKDTGTLAELAEALVSALAGCGMVLMLAFFLSLESWILAATGLR